MESCVNILATCLRSSFPFDVNGNCFIQTNFLGIIYSGKRDFSSDLICLVISKSSLTSSVGTTAPIKCITLLFLYTGTTTVSLTNSDCLSCVSISSNSIR